MRCDPITKRFPQQDLQPTSHITHTLLSENRYLHFNDSHISQEILTNITKTFL